LAATIADCARILVIIDNNLPRRMQSGSAGYADKSGSCAISPVETVAGTVKNL
jgi:hypothetical protein